MLTEISGLFPSLSLHVDRLPLASFGLGWLIPALAAAVIGGVIGMFFPRKQKELKK